MILCCRFDCCELEVKNNGANEYRIAGANGFSTSISQCIGKDFARALNRLRHSSIVHMIVRVCFVMENICAKYYTPKVCNLRNICFDYIKLVDNNQLVTTKGNKVVKTDCEIVMSV